MTDEQKYLEALKSFGELIQKKNSEITYQQYEIKRLKGIIEKAETEMSSEITVETR